MDRSFKIILQAAIVTTLVTLWCAISILLCLVISYMKLLEIFLIMIGGIVLTFGGVVLAREVSKLLDLIHWQRIRKELRELEIQERKQEQSQFTLAHRRSVRGRYR